MFTGIIEDLGKIVDVEHQGTNINFQVKSNFTNELKVDQSVAHNGVCLTVTEINNEIYSVTAIEETLHKTNLKNWKKDSVVNLERSLTPSSRMDGHFVQGHVDCVTELIHIEKLEGSWFFTFSLPTEKSTLIVQKGSVCINGVSLTVARKEKNTFTVAIIPYTYEHTSFNTLVTGDNVNIEFDILGKYIIQFLNQRS